ncbi:MAG: hypothetical protein E7232_06520 [Lachnospiraceae bacterium]|nr:hypothetical protein [Lachnospiraceae bacterium]
MIKYEDGEFLDLLPSFFKEKEDFAAISYAFKMAIASLIMGQKETKLYADIDKVPEDILDLMALESKAPYYSEDLPIEQKRELVKNAILWREKAGTKSAVQDLIRTVFGYGEIVEWFDFTEGEQIPGYFDIETGAQLTPELFEMFTKVIESVKNESSHLRRIGIEREIDGNLYIGTGVIASPRYVVTQLISDQVDINGNALGAVANTGTPRVIII